MASPLIANLPAIYQEDPFLSKALLAFEKVLLGRIDEEAITFTDPGLEETISRLATYFDPEQAPASFLSWLQDWVALTLRADLPEQTQRLFIANAIRNYRLRGTKASLLNLLGIFLVGIPEVTEEPETPHFFRVTVSLPASLQGDPIALGWQIEIARDIIELEKPAHTYFELDPIFPSMQIGVSSTLGVNTVLGTVPEAEAA